MRKFGIMLLICLDNDIKNMKSLAFVDVRDFFFVFYYRCM